MKNKKNIIYLLILLISKISSQEIDRSYKFSDDIIKRLSIDSMTEYACWDFSYIGEYKKTLEFWDINEDTTKTPNAKQINYFNNFKPTSAIDFINKQSKSEKIIIINEAHHQPLHRVFTKKLLSILYNNGYKYFGSETLSMYDTSINKRKFPTKSIGFYTDEPNYGDLIREAINIGFKIFPYESTRQEYDSSGISLREIDQALNIKRIIDIDSNAKILIHCGFDHIAESNVDAWGKAMAGRLFEYTNINPYTIDQVNLSEHSNFLFENPYYKLIKLDYDAVFIDSLNQSFKCSKDKDKFDISVFHTKTDYKFGRPNWIFNNKRKPYFIKDKINNYPCLVFAYIKEEFDSCRDIKDLPIPYDIIELTSKSDLKALSLKNGNYYIIIKNKTGIDKNIILNLK